MSPLTSCPPRLLFGLFALVTATGMLAGCATSPMVRESLEPLAEFVVDYQCDVGPDQSLEQAKFDAPPDATGPRIGVEVQTRFVLTDVLVANAILGSERLGVEGAELEIVRTHRHELREKRVGPLVVVQPPAELIIHRDGAVEVPI